ncbi:hypothetical protein D046_5716A, partial [Vibrio parahaemolyticus V-223/04]
MVDIMLS